MIAVELKLLVLEGENALLRDELGRLLEMLDWFAADQDFWRRKYLIEHPELDNWDYVESSRDV